MKKVRAGRIEEMTFLSGPEVISKLRQHLKNQSGRHLSVVLGSYIQLETFEKDDLAHAQTVDGHVFPKPINFNRELLACIEDEVLRRMVRDENRRPIMVQNQLNQAFEQIMRRYFDENSFLILKQCELMFAYKLELNLLRTYATNQNHLLLLLPGKRVGQQIQLFHEAGARFQRQFPGQLVTENNLWELKV
jgi:hypothetical protein